MEKYNNKEIAAIVKGILEGQTKEQEVDEIMNMDAKALLQLLEREQPGVEVFAKAKQAVSNFMKQHTIGQNQDNTSEDITNYNFAIDSRLIPQLITRARDHVGTSNTNKISRKIVATYFQFPNSDIIYDTLTRVYNHNKENGLNDTVARQEAIKKVATDFRATANQVECRLVLDNYAKYLTAQKTDDITKTK